MAVRKNILSPEYRANRFTIDVHSVVYRGPGGQPFSSGLDLARKYNEDGSDAACVRQTVADPEIAEKRKGFREFAYQMAAEARKRNLPPVTKQEMDDLWGMDEIVGDN
jgi:hypothetical protein